MRFIEQHFQSKNCYGDAEQSSFYGFHDSREGRINKLEKKKRSLRQKFAQMYAHEEN